MPDESIQYDEWKVTDNGVEVGKTVEYVTEYRWVVIAKDGDVQMGIAPSFYDAMNALAAWHGDGTLDDIQGFTIYPVRRCR